MEFVAHYFTVVAALFAMVYLFDIAKEKGIIIPRRGR